MSVHPFSRHSIWKMPVLGSGNTRTRFRPQSPAPSERRLRFVRAIVRFLSRWTTRPAQPNLAGRRTLDQCGTRAVRFWKAMEERLAEAVPHPGPHRTARDHGPRTRLDAAEGPLSISLGSDHQIVLASRTVPKHRIGDTGRNEAARSLGKRRSTAILPPWRSSGHVASSSSQGRPPSRPHQDSVILSYMRSPPLHPRPFHRTRRNGALPDTIPKSNRRAMGDEQARDNAERSEGHSAHAQVAATPQRRPAGRTCVVPCRTA